jgi:hypothetical protein
MELKINIKNVNADIMVHKFILDKILQNVEKGVVFHFFHLDS